MKNKINVFFTSILFITLTACSSAPTHLIVAPELSSIKSPITSHHYNEKKVQLSVVDMRTSNHIVQILTEGKAATILSSQQRLEEIITESLTNAWKNQHLLFNAQSEEKINITIEKATISVYQKTMSYKTKNEIKLRVEIINNEQTLTNIFKTKSKSEGALQADLAVLERDFNQQLSRLLSNILTSKDIKDFL